MTRICIWRTGHEIADTVAEALAEGFGAPILDYRHQYSGMIHEDDYDAHIAYGILRGTSEVFGLCEQFGIQWFNVDRGYFSPGHYDGYYRISCRGTQARWHEGIPRKPWSGKLEPWRFDKRKPVLVCPPTPAVAGFYGLLGKTWEYPSNGVIRHKGDPAPINWDDYGAVYTFNSSVGWQALQMGIPVLSDINHSIIGSYYKATDLQSLTESLANLPNTRLELFEAMNAHQFTLEEIRQGKAWGLIEHYLSGSASIAGKPSPLMSAPTPSASALKAHYQSNS